MSVNNSWVLQSTEMGGRGKQASSPTLAGSIQLVSLSFLVPSVDLGSSSVPPHHGVGRGHGGRYEPAERRLKPSARSLWPMGPIWIRQRFRSIW